MSLMTKTETLKRIQKKEGGERKQEGPIMRCNERTKVGPPMN